MMLFWCIVASVVGFLSGSIMYSYFIPRVLSGVDVRKIGEDGNPGSTNAIRAAGPAVGGLCMALDVLKAFCPVFVATALLNIRGAYLVPVIVAPALGHAFSPLLGFRGGKAVSASFGSLLGIIQLSRVVFVMAIVLAFFTFVLVIRPNSTRLIAGVACAFAVALFTEPIFSIKVAFSLIMLLLLYKHYSNPDAGENTVSLWHYTIDFRDHRLHLYKV
ncbi:MAG: glycerol-3-phosphate acyltransferase [Clostridia bacterium]|nr:glycerol-3-phosphate acyltransferase [Clostridia bacterium]